MIITKLSSQDEHFFQGWNEFNSCVNVEFHFKGIASVMVVFLQVFIFKSNYMIHCRFFIKFDVSMLQ